ncbi:iron ABC transporter permease [Ammoniphilus sp. CFH 90114]|nr:iron ABC transporter permease [Ammoniphilus sp. CFH 90114]
MAAGFLLILIFFILPIMKLLYLSFTSEAGLSMANYTHVLQQAKTWKTIQNTLYIVGGSTLLSVVLGVFTAWLVAYSDIRGKKIITMLIMLSFIIPSYVATLSWTQLMSPNGLLAQGLSSLPGDWKPWNMYSFSGIIFVMGIHHFPLVFMLTVSVLKKIPRDLEWACRMAGAGRATAFRKMTLPLALPGIASGGLLAFLASLDNFGIPAFLGIPADIRVLSTAIYEEIIGFGPSAFARGATLSVLLGVVALIGTGIQWLLLRNSKRLETVQEDDQPRFSLGTFRRITEFSVYGSLLVLIFVPLLSMFLSSFVRAYGLDWNWQNLTWKNYRFILMDSPKVQNALVNSLVLALVTMGVCLIAGTAIAYFRTRKPSFWTKAMELAVGLPYALPGVVFALAMIFTWMEPIPGWNPGLYGTVSILVIAYISRFMILQVRGSITAMMQVDPSMEEAASVCGAQGVVKWYYVLLPLLLPGMLSGAFLVLLTAFTELTVSSLLWSSGSETVGVVIFNFEQAGATTYSTALSSLIVMGIFVGMILIYGLQKQWKRKGVRS